MFLQMCADVCLFSGGGGAGRYLWYQDPSGGRYLWYQVPSGWGGGRVGISDPVSLRGVYPGK